jgi:hypothetical protein
VNTAHVVRQQGGRIAAGPSCFIEARHDVGGLEHPPGIRADQEPGVIVDRVQDLDVGARGELPVGDVFLPALVGHLGCEPDPRGLRSLLGLGGDEPATGQDPPDRRHRRGIEAATAKVVGDRVRAGIQALIVELLAQRDDRVFNRDGHPASVAHRPPAPRDKPRLPLGRVAAAELVANDSDIDPPPELGCQRCRETPVNYVVKPNTPSDTSVARLYGEASCDLSYSL